MVPADDSMPNVYEEPDPEHDDTMSNDAGVDVGTISDGSAGLVSPQCKKTAIKLVAVSLLIDALLLTIVVSTGTKFLNPGLLQRSCNVSLAVVSVHPAIIW